MNSHMTYQIFNYIPELLSPSLWENWTICTINLCVKKMLSNLLNKFILKVFGVAEFKLDIKI